MKSSLSILEENWRQAGTKSNSIKNLQDKISYLESLYQKWVKIRKIKPADNDVLREITHQLANLYRENNDEIKAKEYFNITCKYYQEALRMGIKIINNKRKPILTREIIGFSLMRMLPLYLELFIKHDKIGASKLVTLWENIFDIIHLRNINLYSWEHKIEGLYSILPRTFLGSIIEAVGFDYKFNKELFKAFRVAGHDISVLIYGETGTGKEIVARLIHLLSKRTNEPFVAVNCGALPEALIESELFGHIKGAFTDAYKDRKGRFQEANGGTLFLDEVGDLPLGTQVKLLRALQEKEITRLGENKPDKVNVRVICATNKKLLEKIKDGSFREDLFYRISTFQISLPPLRARGEDIIGLSKYFIQKSAKELLKQDVTVKVIDQTYKPEKSLVSEAIKAEFEIKIDEEVLKLLQQHQWHGNIRELQNVITRALINFDGFIIKKEDIELDIPSTIESIPSEIKPLTEMEKEHIAMALQQTQGNKTQTAKKLGISKRTLDKKVKDYNIDISNM